MPHPLICRSTVIANQPRNAPSFETLHPLTPCSETPNQRMRRFRGFGVSRLIGISRSICKSEDTANGRMRQMTRSGSFHGHHIRECGVWEDRVSFHDQSANHMMRQFAWSGISREIDKWQDGAISRHCRASRKCCSHIVTLANSWPSFSACSSFLATVSWLVKFLRFAISYFVFTTQYVIGPKP